MANLVAARLAAPSRIGSTLILFVVSAAAVVNLVTHQGDFCYADGTCVTDQALLLVSQANRGYWIRILFVAGCILLYLVSREVPGLSRLYSGSTSMIAHLGWTIAAFEWVAFGALESTFGICSESICINVFVETLRLLAPLLIAIGCFVHGLRPSSSIMDDRRWSARAEAVLAAGFLTLAATLLTTSQLVDAYVVNVRGAFGDVQHRPNYAAQVTSGYWLSPSSEVGSLGAVLDAVPWVLFGLAYLIALKSSSDLGVFFKRCPNYPRGTRVIGAWLVPHWDRIHAWIPIAVTIWLLVAGGIAGSLLNQASQTAARPTGRALALLPLYIALLFPAVGWALALSHGVQSRLRSGTETCDETVQRAAIIRQTVAAHWVLLFVAGLVAGNAYLAFQSATPSSASGPADAADTTASSGFLVALLGPQILGFAAVAFISIALHYVALLEWPYSHGQQIWKTGESQRASVELEAARSSLTLQLAQTQLTPPDQPTPGMLARFLLALEGRRVANEIPVHTFKGFPDVIRKVAEWAGTAAAGALLGHQSAADVARGGLDAVIKLLIALLVGRAAGS
jgi:hypothetical protein